MMSFIKKIKIIYYLLALGLVSCNQGGKNKSSAKKDLVHIGSKNDDFNTFFDRFKTDSIFQKAHVHFPLKYKISAGADEADTVKSITQNQWKFTRLLISKKGKLIFKEIKKSATEVNIQVQMEDTGFEKEFTFLKGNNCWFLDTVTDNSD